MGHGVLCSAHAKRSCKLLHSVCKARLSGGLPNDYANAGKANLLRCYDVYRETLLCGDRYFNPNFDYANPVPTLAAIPYPPIKLNPLYSG